MSALRRAAPLALLFGFASAASAGNPPIVETQVKISSTSGGLAGMLGANDVFGSAVAAIGDLNGDGTDDLAVGAPTSSSPPGGAVWILFRAPDGTVASEARIDSMTPWLPIGAGDDFGRSLAMLGDLDGDGHPELAVGAPNLGPGSLFGPGAVFVLSLSPSGTVLHVKELAEGLSNIPLPATFTGFGYALAAIDDLNGDGLPELAVTDTVGVNSTPVIWLLQLQSDGSALGATPLSPDDAVFAGQIESGDHFGQALAAISDIDGDGWDELAIGAPGAGATQKGAVWIAHLQPGPVVASVVRLSEGESGFVGPLEDDAQFGGALAAGDVDGDGHVELVVGTPFGDNLGATTAGSGAAWVLAVDAAAHVTTETRIAEGEAGFIGPLDMDDQFGSSLALLPDPEGGHSLVSGARGDGGSFVFAPGAVWELTFEHEHTWNDLGSALAGTNGAPLLEGFGDLTGGSPGSLVLSNALPFSVAALVVGFFPINHAFKGGLLVPAPNLLIFGLPTDGTGGLTLPFLWPVGLPSGIAIYFQDWITDAGGPKGFAATNALKAVTP